MKPCDVYSQTVSLNCNRLNVENRCEYPELKMSLDDLTDLCYDIFISRDLFRNIYIVWYIGV